MGFWRIEGRWRVRRQASKNRSLSVETLESRRLLSADIGADVGANIAPKAESDRALTFGNLAVEISVVQNDHDPDGTINPATVRLRSMPTLGTATVGKDGSVVYTPPRDRFGVDRFAYTVEDDAGAVSNLATVVVAIRSIWQNQENPLDVNNDGSFSPIDVLQIVHQLNAGGPRFLTHPPSPPVMPPPFVDVNGDGYLTSADAVFAVTCINGNISAQSLVSWPTDPDDDFSGIGTHPAEGDPPSSQSLPLNNPSVAPTPGGNSSSLDSSEIEDELPLVLDDSGYSRPLQPDHPADVQEYILDSVSRGTPARGWASILQTNSPLAGGIESLELL